ncbi:MAG: glycosyltransferase [Alphaproteobacteria bacterium]|nr:glycosyltransferase [Alphaproteobacteria bacterium]
MAAPIQFAAVMPVGAWHPLLPAALESLAGQTAPLAVAFMDASGDRRVAEAADASGVDFAFRREGPDAGQADAIAEGWARIGGDVVFWLNADDQLAPGALTLAAAAFASDPELAVFYGGSDFVDVHGTITGTHDQVDEVSDLLYRSNLISQPSCFVRRDWAERVGGLDRTLHFTMDWDLWIRLYAAGAPFQRTDAVLSRVFMGEGTKTAQINLARLSEIFRLVNRHAGPFNALKSVLAFARHTAREAR